MDLEHFFDRRQALLDIREFFLGRRQFLFRALIRARIESCGRSLLGHFPGNGIDRFFPDFMQLLEHATEEQTIAENVDSARDTAGMVMNPLIRTVGQNRIRLLVHEVEAMFDVAPRFFEIQGA